MEKVLIENIDELLSINTFLDDELTEDDINNLTIQELKNKLDEIQSRYPNNEIRVELSMAVVDKYLKISFIKLENDEEYEKRINENHVK